MCVKDCGLHNQNIDNIIMFACYVGWLDSSLVELKKIKAQSLKTCLGLRGPQFLAHCVRV